MTTKEDVATKLKDSKLEKIVANLKQEHGTTFTAPQYRIRAELIDGDLASSTKPPKNSMFTRAGHGGGTTQKEVRGSRNPFRSH